MLSHHTLYIDCDGGRGFNLPDFTFEDFVRYGPPKFSHPSGKERERPGLLKSNGYLRYIKDPNLEKYENTFHFLYSNDPPKESDGTLQERKEKHLLLSIRSLILQPGKKAHFTVSRNNNITPWNDIPKQWCG